MAANAPSDAALTAIKASRLAIKFVLWMVILGFGVIFALQFPHNPAFESLWIVVTLHGFVDPLMNRAQELFGMFPGLQPYLKWLPLALLIATWIVKSTIDTNLLQWQKRMMKAQKAAAPPPLPVPVNPNAPVAPVSPYSTNSGVVAPGVPGSGVARAPIPRRHCTFLALEVVQPNQMRSGADEATIAASFQAYQGYVRGLLEENNVWKSAWTPDGVRGCFLQREHAVLAAQRILRGLDEFNSVSNRLPQPFRVRCGVAEGEVSIPEDAPLERVVEHVIDLAGHLQKMARPNTLWLPAEVHDKLADQSGYQLADQTMQGRNIYEWSPRYARPSSVTEQTAAGARGAAAAISLGPGQRLGRYEIVEELGRGAMGAVYKARDPQLGREVAIKVILTANLSPDELKQYKQRFYREAQAAGQMSHPGIITIHDVAEDEVSGQPYLVMEFVQGATLDDLMSGGKKLTIPEMLDIAIHVADALDYAHRRGVIHRDIKPSNILVTADGRAKIADFGVAKLAGTEITQTGQLVGTPAFMSPEQLTGDPVDARSDLFSFGAVLYFMFTGEKPFPGDTVTSVIYKVMQTAPTPARKLNPALPPEVDVILSKVMAKNPDQRYPNGRALAADLEAVKLGRPLAGASQSA
ncbi:MAG TPA: protein kinase [Candidatus Xenobia bacterium]|nr:protein kinase [Candidatus Xenobia bacterium]